jgi:hypothetical protein
MRGVLCVLALVVGLVVGLGVLCSDYARADISAPQPLEAWKDWVLYGNERFFCPSLFDDGDARQCLWPEVLKIDVDGRTGRFSHKWTALVDDWLPLPGSKQMWPGQVTLDGQSVPVLLHNGGPAVYVQAGTVTLEGSFMWGELPETLAIPAITGKIELIVNGSPVPIPFVDGRHHIWLKQPGSQAGPSGAENRLVVNIFRLIEDSVPMRVHNLIRLTVSGESRREDLPPLLPSGVRLLSVKSPLPVKLGEDGQVSVEVKPGQWDLNILTVYHEIPSKLGPAAAPFGKEIWVFKAFPHLRMVRLDGLPSVDASQTTLPVQWRRYPAFIASHGDELRLREYQRGTSDSTTDDLVLHREWWLDFDGKGATIRDNITGRLGQRKFLGLDSNTYLLGHLLKNGQDQLITQTDKLPAGLVLEKGPLQVTAVSRIAPLASGVPFALGWNCKFNAASGVVNLPPGWQLLGVKGGTVPEQSTWLSRWSLLDFFLILVISLAVSRLKGRLWGVIFLAGLALTWQEAAAPRYVWLVLIIVLPLLRLLAGGEAGTGSFRYRVVKTTYVAALLVLAAASLMFARGQLRTAIYPQLEPHDSRFVERRVAPQTVDKLRRKAGGMKRTSPRPERAMMALQEDAEVDRSEEPAYVLPPDRETTIQTGPPAPGWRWKTVPVNYGLASGQQTITFWLLSPAANSVSCVVRVAALLMLVFCFFNVDLIGSWRQQRWIRRVAVLAAGIGVLGLQSQAHADIPSADLLSELEARLLKPHPCYPECAAFERAAVSVEELSTDNLFTIDLEVSVHAVVKTVVPLPYGEDTWFPSEITLDGQALPSMIRRDRSLFVPVPKGVHTLHVRGRARRPERLRFLFPLQPYSVSVRAPGWLVSGIDAHHQVPHVLVLTRDRATTASGEASLSQSGRRVADYFIVERDLALGLEWRVTTRLERQVLSGAKPAMTVAVPLISGELVRTQGMTVKDGHVMVDLPAETAAVTWESSLPIVDKLELVVPVDSDWAEVWRLTASPFWNINAQGVPTTYLDHRPETHWYPRPGESLIINPIRLYPAPGATSTIDAVRVDYTIGEGYNRMMVAADVRTSKGGIQTILPPVDCILRKVQVNGQRLPVSSRSNELSIPLQPGRQTIDVEWHQPVIDGQSWIGNILRPKLMRLPEVDLSGISHNIDVNFHVPENCWLLFAGGPRQGPAVLIWSYLAVIALAAVLLGKFSRTPVKTHQWFLLGCGLVTLDVPTMVMVPAWFVAMSIRRKQSPESPLSFNLMQIGLAIWTVLVVMALYRAVQQGLLGTPDMQVIGNGSGRRLLHWTQDRSDKGIAGPWMIVGTLHLYRLFMFAWALWAATRVLTWARWALDGFRSRGWWRKMPLPPKRSRPAELDKGTDSKV